MIDEKTVMGVVTNRFEIDGAARLKVGINGTAMVGGKAVKELRFLPLTQFPDKGLANTLYIDVENDRIYYWDGSMYRSLGGQDSEIVIAKTTNEWESDPQHKSVYGAMYIYTDYRYEDAVPIPAIKIGDGEAYVVDLPFFDTGVTQSDRSRWDNKVSVTMSIGDPENLILYT